MSQGSPTRIGDLTAAIWTDFAHAEPGTDFTRIHHHIERSRRIERSP